MTYAWFDVSRNAGIARIMHMSYRSKTYTWNDVILVKRSMIRVLFSHPLCCTHCTCCTHRTCCTCCSSGVSLYEHGGQDKWWVSLTYCTHTPTGSRYIRFEPKFVETLFSWHAPYSSSRCPYQKDKRAKSGNLPKSDNVSEMEEHWIEKYRHLYLNDQTMSYIDCFTQGVSGWIVNILGGGSMDHSE